jgi:hypothetical protein
LLTLRGIAGAQERGGDVSARAEKRLSKELASYLDGESGAQVVSSQRDVARYIVSRMVGVLRYLPTEGADPKLEDWVIDSLSLLLAQRWKAMLGDAETRDSLLGSLDRQASRIFDKWDSARSDEVLAKRMLLATSDEAFLAQFRALLADRFSRAAGFTVLLADAPRDSVWIGGCAALRDQSAALHSVKANALSNRPRRSEMIEDRLMTMALVREVEESLSLKTDRASLGTEVIFSRLYERDGPKAILPKDFREVEDGVDKLLDKVLVADTNGCVKVGMWQLSSCVALAYKLRWGSEGGLPEALPTRTAISFRNAREYWDLLSRPVN